LVTDGLPVVDLWLLLVLSLSVYGRSVVGLVQGYFWGCLKGGVITLSTAKDLNIFWDVFVENLEGNAPHLLVLFGASS
jgi:hypothetical protein